MSPSRRSVAASRFPWKECASTRSNTDPGGDTQANKVAARFQLHVVGGAEDFQGRTPRNAQGRLDALDQTRPQDWVAHVRLGLLPALDRIEPGCRAGPKPRELREDVPHPVRPLPAAPDLGKRPRVIVRLGLHESVQVERIVLACVGHDQPPRAVGRTGAESGANLSAPSANLATHPERSNASPEIPTDSPDRRHSPAWAGRAATRWTTSA